MISLKSIRTSASSASYTRGNQVYKQGKVQDLQKTEDQEVIYVSANVDGSYRNQYHVALKYDKKTDSFKEYTCECEAWASYSGMCKH